MLSPSGRCPFPQIRHGDLTVCVPSVYAHMYIVYNVYVYRTVSVDYLKMIIFNVHIIYNYIDNILDFIYMPSTTYSCTVEMSFIDMFVCAGIYVCCYDLFRKKYTKQ